MKSNRGSAGRYSIGIEIGGTKTQVGIGTAEGKLLQATVHRMAVERTQGASAIRRNLITMVDAALASGRLTLGDIGKIGIGFGGPVDALRGVTLQSFQIAGWEDFPLKKWAEKQWGKPVFLENDASTAGLAESRFGNGRGFSRLFYITLGSGVGGGWILNGNIDNGQGLGAAEIGHLWVTDPQTGEAAELELICSGWAIGRRARIAASEMDSIMLEIAGSLEAIDARVVYAAARQGDEPAVRVLTETCRTLGMAIANIVALLHPERVILGGGVSLMGPIFWKRLKQEFQSRVMPVFAPGVDLVPAKLKENVVLIGSLCLGS